MARKATVNQARALRRMAPATERYLWKLLRDRRLDDFKFRRQVPVGPYVLDFVCLRHRPVIEADGPFHEVEKDEARDAWLVANGFRVLRLTNREVGGGRDHLFARIIEMVAEPARPRKF